MNENQNNREVKEDGLKAIWKKIFELIKKITGDVDFNKDGTLQAQILKKVSTDEMKNVEVEFSSQDTTNVTTWTDVEVLASGEKHQSVLNKVSTMFKNIRYLYRMLGTADISTLGEGADIGTVTGALSKLNSDKVPLIQLGAISDDINTAFEIAFNILQTNVPIVASISCGGMWFIYGYIYNGRTYGFLYGIRFDAKTHMIKCFDGVISHL